MRVLLAAYLLAASGPQTPQPENQQVPYVFEARVDMVSVPVAVTDEEGKFVTGLEAGAFSVFEDGVRQEIRLFAAGLKESWVGLPPDLKDELSGRQLIGLLLDASGSMEDDMDLVRQAALKFLTNVPKTENLFVMDFDENIRLSQYSSDDQRLISDRVYDVEAEGWTALYDAVATFLDRIYALDGRKTLVVFSDGVDSRSTLGMGDVLDMVRLSDATIHSIHIGAASSRNSTRTFEEGRFLRQLSSETGGSYAFGESLEGLDELYDKILEELFSQYTIGYVSTNTKSDGKYRKIKVEVNLEDVKVRARRGYTGPSPE
jgi:VWFA-related protein